MNLEIPAAYKNVLRVGTCSWKYDSWKGLLYDAGTKYHPDDYLVDYSRHLNTVEVDQWFWSLFPAGARLPDEKTVRAYAASVPEDFVFTVKAPNAITLTHYYAKQPQRDASFANKPNDDFLSVGLLERFLSALEPLAERLGPIMFQFEYLNKNKMPSKKAFLDRLSGFFSKAPVGYQYAVETRNPNFLDDSYFDFLRERGLAHVFLDGYYMPPIAEVFEQYNTRTAGFSIVRLHGRGRDDMEKRTEKKWTRIVEPQPDGIRTAVEIVKKNAAESIKTYININNHYEGSAPLTAERFLKALEEAG